MLGVQQKRSVILVLIVAKNVNFKLSGDEFFMMSNSKIMVPLYSPGFLLYGVEFAIVLVTYVKHSVSSSHGTICYYASSLRSPWVPLTLHILSSLDSAA